MRLLISMITLFLLQPAAVFGQSSIDPSSALLLNNSSSSREDLRKTSTEPRLESGRYTVRPRVSERAEKSERVEKPVKHVETSPMVITPDEKGNIVIPVIKSEVKTETKLEAKPEPKPDSTPDSKNLGGNEAPIASARPRLIDVSLASAYLYEGSESGYSYRNTMIAGPAYSAGAKVWLAPEFGIGGRFISTLGGQISDRSAAVSASRTEMSYGAFFKKSFKGSNLVFGAEYFDSQFKVANETISKIKTKSAGVRLSLEGEFGSKDESSWLLGFSAAPKIQHDESPASTDAKSGTSASAYSVGASIERRWKFDPANAISIRVEHRIERDLFSGSATAADAVSGVTPTGVAVTVGTTLIQFGYHWGG